MRRSRRAAATCLLDNAASAKVQKYHEAYVAPDRDKTLLRAVLSTSGHIHGEFLRLLTSSPIAGQSSSSTSLQNNYPSKLFFRRAECFFHDRAATGLGCAQATAIRTHVASHTVRHLPHHLSLRAARSPPPSLPSSSRCLSQLPLVLPTSSALGLRYVVGLWPRLFGCAVAFSPLSLLQLLRVFEETKK